MNFVDVMVIDPTALTFLLAIFPGLDDTSCSGSPWPFQSWCCCGGSIRSGCRGLRRLAECLPASRRSPGYRWRNPSIRRTIGTPNSHVSNFARSGADAVSEFLRNGYMESDAVVTDRLKTHRPSGLRTRARRRRTSSWCTTSRASTFALPGIKVPAGYGPHFRSFDGKQRNFIVEGAGGPSWYTEYNVLAGLSARSFGRFAYFVTRIAAGRVERGLPRACAAAAITPSRSTRRSAPS